MTEVWVLGSGTPWPEGGRGPSSFAVVHGMEVLVLDCGAGASRRLVAMGRDPVQITALALSHEHPDHCGDLLAWLFACRVQRRPGRLPLLHPEGMSRALDALCVGWPSLFEWPGGGVDRMPLASEHQIVVGSFNISATSTAHSVDTRAYRVQLPDASVAYTADTGPSDAVTLLANGVDLLLVECGGSDVDPHPWHLGPSDVARLLSAARPAEAWVTHIPPHADATAAIAEIAKAGLRIRRAEDGDVWRRGWTSAASPSTPD